METMTIKHALGEWPLTIHASFDTVPTTATDFQGSCSNGWPTSGQVVAYVKRVAKHTPSRNDVWHVWPFRGRWFLHVDAAERKQ